MKFSAIVKGTRQDESVDLPPHISQDPETPPIKAVVRALNGIEEEFALANAAERARAQKAAKCESGDPIYELCLMVETVCAGFCDPDSPKTARVPLFDGGADQVREFFGREAITLMYSIQQEYQDRVAPTFKKLSPIEFFTGAQVLGGDDEQRARSFFVRCSVGLQWSYMRTLACQLVNSLAHSSTSGADSAANGQTTKSEPDATIQ